MVTAHDLHSVELRGALGLLLEHELLQREVSEAAVAVVEKGTFAR